MNSSIATSQTDTLYPGLKRDEANVLVVGMGVTGLSVVRFLVAEGMRVSVVDSRENPPQIELLRDLLSEASIYRGEFSAKAFEEASHIVVSPGVALEQPELVKAREAGKVILGDIDLFAQQVSQPIVAITGSNGKSTVTTLVGLMAEQSGRKVAVGGNLGRPALDLLAEPEVDLYVLELSSFQLDSCQLLNAKVATVLNVSEDHLDRYVDFAGYTESKAGVFKGNGLMVLNRDDSKVMAMAKAEREMVSFGLGRPQAGHFGIAEYEGDDWLCKGEQRLMAVSQLKIKGRHNQVNALAALALGESVGLPMTAMLTALSEFKGLEHRMQWVAEVNGVEWINDSKATNVGACEAALQGLSNKIVLIAGGDGKEASFSPLVAVVKDKVKAVVVMGQDSDRLAVQLSPVTEVVKVANMAEAVACAAEVSEAGDTVLLSPACASLDQYSSYQARGNCFIDAVAELSK